MHTMPPSTTALHMFMFHVSSTDLKMMATNSGPSEYENIVLDEKFI